jgi:hypothetical protein
MLGLMTEVTPWQDPQARRGVHHSVPGLPEPTRTWQVSRSSQQARDGAGRPLEGWLEDLTVASTVGAD